MSFFVSCTVNPEHLRNGDLCGKPASWIRYLCGAPDGTYCQDCYINYGPTQHAQFLPHIPWHFERIFTKG
jgi:hypothetical protein